MPSNPFDSFKDLTDPRSEKSKIYPLSTIIFLTISAVVAGAESFVEIDLFGKEKVDWLKKYVDCPDDRTPSHDILGDFFKRLDPEEFETCFINWTSQVCNITEGDLIAIDGKRLRGSYDKHKNKAAIHMVSAWSTNNKIVLGQVKVDDKSNEITAIPTLLNLLEIKGAIVSIDAMGCQKGIAEEIVNHGGDYILAVKGNQGELYEQVKAHFNYTKVSSVSQTINKGHGRIETRKCTVLNDLKLLDEAIHWKGIKTIVRIESTREEILSGAKSSEVRYYISSKLADAKDFNLLIRSHWGIENSLHWVLDVNFGEDNSRIRNVNADENFSIIRRVALNLIKLDDTKKASQRSKRKMASWNTDFLEVLLKL